MNSPMMQRLKKIDQHGIAYYFTDLKSFTRYDHSIGVYLLVKAAKAPYTEQIAALLHDASHTAFSHTGDFLFEDKGNFHHENAYQDVIHLKFLKKMLPKDILESHGLSLETIDPKLQQYKALEQNYPDMCADRIQYNLQTGLLFGKITLQDVQKILQALKFENEQWYFTDKNLAQKFADLSVWFTENFWSSEWNEALNIWAGKLLRRALQLKIITEDDIHYGTDQSILEKIFQSTDPHIQLFLKKLENPNAYYKIGNKKKFTHHRRQKFRGIDPWVKTKGKSFQRLTKLAPDFKKEYLRVQQKMHRGTYIILK